MKIYKYWKAGPLAPKTADEIRKYTYEEIKQKYKNGAWYFEINNLLHQGYIIEMGWIQDFQDELNIYLYWSSAGTGIAWAPNVKLLEKALCHKVFRAFNLKKKSKKIR